MSNLQQQTKPNTNQLTMDKLLESYKPQILAALPKHLTPDRMARIALTEYRKFDKKIIAGLDTLSFLGAIIQCAQLGLEPGSSLGLMYLVPFKNGKRSEAEKRDVYEIQVITGYRGKVQLARNSDQIVTIGAECIKENDFFEYGFGPKNFPTHKPPKLSEPRGDTIGAWAWAELKGGGVQFIVLSLEDIERARNASRGGKDHYSPWSKWFDEMSKKTAIHRLCKLLPVSVELQTSQELDELVDSNVSQNNRTLLDKTFEADWQPMDDATSMMQVEENKQDEKLLEQHYNQFVDEWDKVEKRLNLSTDEVSKRLGIKGEKDVETWSKDKFVAAVVMMRGWTK